MSTSKPSDSQTLSSRGAESFKFAEYDWIFHLFQLQQQNASTSLNQVSQSVAAIDNRLDTIMYPSTKPPSASSQPPTSVSASHEPDLRPSENCVGDTEQCGGFLLQCNLAFA